MSVCIHRRATPVFAGPMPTLGTFSVSSPAEIGQEVLDWPFYESTRDVLGYEMMDELLGQLADLMRERLSVLKTLMGDPSQLAREAHALISAACMLGFAELSDACRNLEAGCYQGSNVALLLQRLDLVHERALRVIVSLRQAA